MRYAESSMRNGFGLRLLHKFLSVPFLRLQRTSLLEQLQRNQKDMEDAEKELDDFQVRLFSHLFEYGDDDIARSATYELKIQVIDYRFWFYHINKKYVQL